MSRTPSYRLHKPTNQAVVTLNGRDHYLGVYGSEKSRAEYDRLIAEWLSNGRQFAEGGPDGLTVNEVLMAFLRHAEGYYRKDGKPTGELDNIKLAIRPLRKLYGHTFASKFGPLALKAVRSSMVESGLCRNEVNKRIGKLTRVFRWAVENELIPASVHHGLKAVAGLKKGRSDARESRTVKPVPEAFVEAVEPFVAPQVWAMIQLQRLTGMRPGEVTQMRTCDIDQSGKLWVFTPESHKTEHHGKRREIPLGPRAQDILRPWLRADPTAYLFSPREASEQRWAERRRNRKSPMTPSQAVRGRKAKPKRTPGERYDTRAYAHAISRACVRAFPHRELSQSKANDLTSEQRTDLKAWRRPIIGTLTRCGTTRRHGCGKNSVLMSPG
jgi:integrase